MSELKNILIEFEQTLKENNIALFNLLQDGLTNDEISILLSKIDILFDVELHTLYNWRNGVKYESEWVVGEFNLFSFGVMLSLEDVSKHLDILKRTTKLGSESLLPLFASGNGDYVLYQADVKSSEFGRLFLYAPSIILSENPVIIYDSLKSFLKTLIECYKQGAYEVNDEGVFNVNYDLEQKISGGINKYTEFWN